MNDENEKINGDIDSVERDEDQVESQDETQEQGQVGQEDYEEEPMKFHVPLPIVVAFVAIVILDVFCMIRFPKVVKEYKSYHQAEERIEQGYTSGALNDLYEVAENHPDSVPIMVKLIRLSMNNGYYDMAGYIFDNYLAGKEVDEDIYDEMDSYFSELEDYYATYDAIYTIYNDKELSVSDGDTEAYYNHIRDELQSLLNDNGMHEAYIHYYIAFNSIETEDALNELMTCYEIDPEFMDVRVQLGTTYRRMGELDTAKQFIDEALAKDVEDSAAWRVMSTITMVEGDLTAGLEYAQKAYELNADGAYVRDTYLIALHANNQKEKEQAIMDELVEVNETLDADTESFLKDEITLTEYYIGE